MSIRSHCAIALLSISAILGGCATNRSEIKLSSPAAAPTPQAVTKARTVVIQSIKDERVFEQAPASASIPSLGFEGAQQATEGVKARAVARKRNGYGKAMGDVLLQEGQTVADLVRENLTTAFQQAGYRVANENAAGPNPLLVDVRIKQFWSWMQPGFWALTLNSRIETSLQLAGAGPVTTISVQAEDSRQMATDGAWLEIVEKGLAAYRAQAAEKLSGPPF